MKDLRNSLSENRHTMSGICTPVFHPFYNHFSGFVYGPIGAVFFVPRIAGRRCEAVYNGKGQSPPPLPVVRLGDLADPAGACPASGGSGKAIIPRKG